MLRPGPPTSTQFVQCLQVSSTLVSCSTSLVLFARRHAVSALITFPSVIWNWGSVKCFPADDGNGRSLVSFHLVFLSGIIISSYRVHVFDVLNYLHYNGVYFSTCVCVLLGMRISYENHISFHSIFHPFFTMSSTRRFQE